MPTTRRRWMSVLAAALFAGCAPQPVANLKDTPPRFQVRFETSKGDFVVDVHRDWSPNGTARFHDLVKAGYYDGCRFFRVVPGFVVQWGINGDPQVNARWKDVGIPDDRPTGDNKQSSQRGFMTFAKTDHPNSRTTQVYINYGGNRQLDSRGFTPFAQVIEGMDVVDAINARHGQKPQQDQIHERGNAYLDAEFPGLDFIKKATIVESAVVPTVSPTSAGDQQQEA